jgi:hypothetical protein
MTAVTSLSRVVLRELTPSEAVFQARVITLARSLDWLAYHTRWSRHSERGYPDLCLVRPPRLVYAELKVWPRTTLRPAQAVWIDRLRQVPHIETYVWVWVFGNDIEQAIATILARD